MSNWNIGANAVPPISFQLQYPHAKDITGSRFGKLMADKPLGLDKDGWVSKDVNIFKGSLSVSSLREWCKLINNKCQKAA